MIGYSLGGRPSERGIARLGLPISGDTILRRLKKRSKPANNGAGIVGLDEWAKRKGLNYGTIVVDLERRTVIDVLDEATLSAACYRGGGVVFEVNPAAHDRYLRALRRSGTLKISRQV